MRRIGRDLVDNLSFDNKIIIRPTFFAFSHTACRLKLASYPGLPSQLSLQLWKKSVGKAWKQTSRDACHRFRHNKGSRVHLRPGYEARLKCHVKLQSTRHRTLI